MCRSGEAPRRRGPGCSSFFFYLGLDCYSIGCLAGSTPAHRLNMQERASRFVRRAQEQIGARVAVDPELPAAFKFVPGLVHKLGDFETLAGNRVELLPNYIETIDRIIGDIDSAHQT